MYQGKLQFIKAELVDPPLSEEAAFDNQCSICLDLATFPVRCSICKTIFCLRCASVWKSEHDSCPKKCQSPWTYELIQSLGIKLKCPYGLDKCPVSTPETLVEHLEKCLFKPNEVGKALHRRKKYLCEKDHLLQFWVGTFEEMIGVQCSQCSEKYACRSRCQLCQTLYCVNCRPPPCSKTLCPNKHPFILTVASKGYICDVCGLQPSSSGHKVYDDIRCNFGFCEWCHSKLPAEPTVLAKPNNYSTCQQGHRLTFIKPTDDICYFCQNKKTLVRQCKQCQRRYCSSCKAIRIRKNGRCQLGHELTQIQGQQHQQHCKSCNTAIAQYEDQECDLALCYICLDNLMSQQRNLERLAGLFCQNNHRLRKMEKNRLTICRQCHTERHCSVQCYYCGAFCLECRPSNIDPCCYVGHDLRKIVKGDVCQKCLKEDDRFQECEQCDARVCLQCYDKGI